MPISNLKGRVESLPIRRFELDDFGGGLDLRSDPIGGDPRFQLQATNALLYDGKAACRRGTSIAAVLPATAIGYFYESVALGFVYGINESASNKVYKTTYPYSVAWTDVSAGAPATTDSDCVEFNGVLVFATTAGIYTLDGAGVWTLRTAAVTGRSIAVWQNKLWVAGTGSRVYFSAAGDYTTWNALDYVDIREGSGDTPVLGLHVTQEMDSQGRPSLLAGKKTAVYRINNATTGSFTTMTEEAGWIHKRAVVSGGGLTYFIDRTGIFATNGVSRPEKISTRIDPMFSNYSSTIQNLTLPQPAPVYHDGRFIFSIPGYNPLTNVNYNGPGGIVHLDYDPKSGCFAEHQWPCFGVGTPGNVQAWLSQRQGPFPGLLFASDANAQVFRVFGAVSGSDDNGIPNKAVIQTPYFQLADGKRFRLHRLRLTAKFVTLASGTPFTLRVRKDGSVSDSIVRTLTSGQVSPPAYLTYDFNRLGDCRSVSFVFELPVVSSVANTSPTNDPYKTLTAQTNEISRALVEFTPTGRN